MTVQEKCIIEMYNLIDEITEKATKRDLSLFRIAGVSGCDMYSGTSANLPGKRHHIEKI